MIKRILTAIFNKNPIENYYDKTEKQRINSWK